MRVFLNSMKIINDGKLLDYRIVNENMFKKTHFAEYGFKPSPPDG